MANIKNQFHNINERQTQNTIVQGRVDVRHYLREPHGIQEGIRKDKKIKMNRKLYN